MWNFNCTVRSLVGWLIYCGKEVRRTKDQKEEKEWMQCQQYLLYFKRQAIFLNKSYTLYYYVNWCLSNSREKRRSGQNKIKVTGG